MLQAVDRRDGQRARHLISSQAGSLTELDALGTNLITVSLGKNFL